jgi:hypothetical protein
VSDAGTYGPKHVAFIDDIIKSSSLCLMVMCMSVLKHNQCDVLEAQERYADEERDCVRTW